MDSKGTNVMLSINCATMLEPARDLKKFLVSHGYTVFLCEQMAGGENYRTEISINAAKCGAMIAFMNKRWCGSGECSYEFNIALRMCLSGTTGLPKLVPLILEDFNVYQDYPTIIGVLCSFNGIVLNPAELNSSAWDKVLASLQAAHIPSGPVPSGGPTPPVAKEVPAVSPPVLKLTPSQDETVKEFFAANPLPAVAGIVVPPVVATPAVAPKQITNFPKPTQYAGKGVKGNRNGSLMFSSFESITGMATDERDDSIYVTTLAHTVRKINAKGVVSTFAGFQDEPGDADGHSSMATFNSPSGVAVGSDGSIYVSDGLNLKIRRVYPDGNVFSVAGLGKAGERSENIDGYANCVPIGHPGGIAVDRKENAVYFVDGQTHSVRKVFQGTLVTIAGTGKAGFAEGSGDKAQFDGPDGIALLESDGSVLVADKANNRIRKISSDGTVSTFAGTGKKGQDDGPANSATFYFPTSITVDSRSGSVYVADQFGSLIRKISNGTVSTIGELPNSKITAMTVRHDSLFVAEPYTIRKLPL